MLKGIFDQPYGQRKYYDTPDQKKKKKKITPITEEILSIDEENIPFLNTTSPLEIQQIKKEPSKANDQQMIKVFQTFKELYESSVLQSKRYDILKMVHSTLNKEYSAEIHHEIEQLLVISLKKERKSPQLFQFALSIYLAVMEKSITTIAKLHKKLPFPNDYYNHLNQHETHLQNLLLILKQKNIISNKAHYKQITRLMVKSLRYCQYSDYPLHILYIIKKTPLMTQDAYFLSTLQELKTFISTKRKKPKRKGILLGFFLNLFGLNQRSIEDRLFDNI